MREPGKGNFYQDNFDGSNTCESIRLLPIFPTKYLDVDNNKINQDDQREQTDESELDESESCLLSLFRHLGIFLAPNDEVVWTRFV